MSAAAVPVNSNLLRLLVTVCLLALPAVTGCDEESLSEAQAVKPTPTVSGEVASFSFDAVVYVDPAANNIAVLDRVRSVTRSGLSALQHRRITTSQKRQVDIDLKRLTREPVTVIDPATKAAHPAIRVRYRHVGVGVVPKEIAQRGDVLLGLLHNADAARAASVVEACNDPAERAGDAVKQPWRAFDPGLEACGRAMDAEQTKIDEARVGLEHPEREIVPIEEDRLYLPVLLHVRSRAPKLARPASTPGEIESAPGAAAAEREGPAKSDEAAAALGASPRGNEAPSPPPARASGDVAEPRPAAVREGPAKAGSGAASKPAGPRRAGDDLFGDGDPDPDEPLATRSEMRLLARLKEQDRQERDRGGGADDYGMDTDTLRRPASGVAPGGGDFGARGQPTNYGSSSHESPTNYALLWVASLAVLAILGAEVRRRFRRKR